MRSRDRNTFLSWIIYHSFTSQHTTFEVSSFTDCKDMVWVKIYTSVTWPWPRPLGVLCHSKDNTWYILPAYKIWRGDSSFSHSRNIIVGPKIYQKLSYRRGIARRAILLNSCCVSRDMGARKASNTNVTFKDIQGHWQWCHSIGHIRFLLDFQLQLQPCLYLAQFPKYHHLFPKCKEVTWP